ncbi:hypothetical protein EDD11_006898, partial [Mortierella claussenii]
MAARPGVDQALIDRILTLSEAYHTSPPSVPEVPQPKQTNKQQKQASTQRQPGSNNHTQGVTTQNAPNYRNHDAFHSGQENGQYRRQDMDVEIRSHDGESVDRESASGTESMEEDFEDSHDTFAHN